MWLDTNHDLALRRELNRVFEKVRKNLQNSLRITLHPDTLPQEIPLRSVTLLIGRLLGAPRLILATSAKHPPALGWW
jgi:hypothetical protein